jgi:hypothetical protein
MGIDRAKLALLIPRLASNFDGEVVATVRAILRVLGASGNDLHDLARIVEKDTPEPKNAHSRKQSEHHRQSQDRPDDIIAFAGRLLETCSRLTDWERDFLTNIRNQARDKYWFKLSEKQQAVVNRLRGKYG